MVSKEIVLGMLDLSWLAVTYRVTKFEHAPIDVGILPVKELKDTSNKVIDDRLEAVGIVP